MARIAEKDLKVLWAKSGNHCALCKFKLTMSTGSGDEAVGHMAHIAGKKPGSARYDAKMTNQERNSYANLILLCPNCHALVDKDERQYTVSKLTISKRNHEGWVQTIIRKNMTEVTFYELDIVLQHLVANMEVMEEGPMSVVLPRDKIKRNGLSALVERHLMAGMMISKEVENYFNNQLDADDEGRIRTSFIQLYNEFKDSGANGDETFFGLMSAVSNYSSDFKYQSAGLGVLAHYFQICEVFEK